MQSDNNRKEALIPCIKTNLKPECNKYSSQNRNFKGERSLINPL